MIKTTGCTPPVLLGILIEKHSLSISKRSAHVCWVEEIVQILLVHSRINYRCFSAWDPPPWFQHRDSRGSSTNNAVVHSRVAFLHLTWGSSRYSDNLAIARDIPAIYSGSHMLNSNDPEHLICTPIKTQYTIWMA